MTDDTKIIAISRVPTWLVDQVDALADKMSVSRSAAALALLAVGWHNATIDIAERDTEPEEMKAFGDAYEAWQDAGGASPLAEFDDLEWYLISEILPSKHGGQRPGAGRPKAD